MTDHKIPDLPSDDDLGITDDDRRSLDEEPPELTEEERRALGLGQPPSGEPPPPPPPPPPGTRPGPVIRPRPPEPPRTRWRGPATLAALLAAAWLSSASRTLPDPLPANAPETAFSSARAMSMDVAVARTAHPTGSPAHTEVREYLMGRLRDLGLQPEVHTATAVRSLNGRVRAATVRNIVARLPGTASTGAILLVSHYDGAGISRAAADDGAGVVATLEAVRALRAGEPLRNDVIVLVTDAEELGLLGAQAFVDEHPWMADVAVVLNVEMRGAGGPSIMFQTGAENGWIVQAMRDAGIGTWANSMSGEVYRRMPNDTDFTRFLEAGKQGLNFAAMGRASVYHQTYDAPANLSEATLQHHGENLLGLTRHLGGVQLDVVDGADVAYFTLPYLGVVTSVLGLTLPVAAWMLLTAVLILLAVLRSAGRWPGLLVGLGLGLVAVGLTGGAGYGLLRWLPRFHEEYGSLVGSLFHHEGWYVLTLVGVGLFVVSGLFGVARRWFPPAVLAWGALLIPLGGAAYATFAAPAAAMNLQWPVVAAYLATGALLLRPGAKTTLVVWLLALLLALPVLVFLQPLTELMWLGMSFAAAPWIGVLIATALLLLLPALDFLREPNGWWAPVAGLLFAGACLGLGVRAAEPTPDRPAPSTLAWTYDHGTDEALWVTRAPGGYGPAQAWAETQVSAPFSSTDSLQRPGIRAGAQVAPAEAVEVAPVEAWIVADSVLDGLRRIRLALRSAIGAELLEVRFPEGGAARPTAVGGRPLPAEGAVTVVEHWGVPDPAVLLDVELPAGETLALQVLERHFRPTELVGDEAFQRPPELAPDVVRASDRATVWTPASALRLQAGPPPFPLEPAADIPAAPRDTTAVPADTLSVPPDTTPRPADTLGALADTMAAPPDTTRIRP